MHDGDTFQGTLHDSPSGRRSCIEDTPIYTGRASVTTPRSYDRNDAQENLFGLLAGDHHRRLGFEARAINLVVDAFKETMVLY